MGKVGGKFMKNIKRIFEKAKNVLKSEEEAAKYWLLSELLDKLLRFSSRNFHLQLRKRMFFSSFSPQKETDSGGFWKIIIFSYEINFLGCHKLKGITWILKRNCTSTKSFSLDLSENGKFISFSKREKHNRLTGVWGGGGERNNSTNFVSVLDTLRNWTSPFDPLNVVINVRRPSILQLISHFYGHRIAFLSRPVDVLVHSN